MKSWQQGRNPSSRMAYILHCLFRTFRIPAGNETKILAAVPKSWRWWPKSWQRQFKSWQHLVMKSWKRGRNPGSGTGILAAVPKSWQHSEILAAGPKSWQQACGMGARGVTGSHGSIGRERGGMGRERAATGTRSAAGRERAAGRSCNKHNNDVEWNTSSVSWTDTSMPTHARLSKLRTYQPANNNKCRKKSNSKHTKDPENSRVGGMSRKALKFGSLSISKIL